MSREDISWTEYRPTMNLRQKQMPGRTSLEQEWEREGRTKSGHKYGETEWRTVPFVDENGDDVYGPDEERDELGYTEETVYVTIPGGTEEEAK